MKEKTIIVAPKEELLKMFVGSPELAKPPKRIREDRSVKRIEGQKHNVRCNWCPNRAQYYAVRKSDGAKIPFCTECMSPSTKIEWVGDVQSIGEK